MRRNKHVNKILRCNTNARYTENYFRQLVVAIEAGESHLKSFRHLGGALLF
jgi:hypothetical protein